MKTFIAKDYEFDANFEVKAFKLPFFKIAFAVLRPDKNGYYKCSYCYGPHATKCSSCGKNVIHTRNWFKCGCGESYDSGIWTDEEEKDLVV